MDQDNSKGQDKRNWRERLGIGAQGGKDLPKISDDFRKEPAPPAASVRPVATARPAPRVAVPTVKPAPMAPRATVSVAPRANPTMAPRTNPKAVAAPSPVSPDKLAERLRSQREASTKLAEQRVQVAKQRAETQYAPPPVAAPQPPQGAKPKFTFAEENAAPRPVAVPPIRPAAPMPQAAAPQLSPARPPLGGGPQPANSYVPRPPQAPVQPQSVPGYPQAPLGAQQPFQPNYNQQPVPPYRPIDPNSGYVPQPGYAPQQRGFASPPMQQSGYAQQPVPGPRLNVPQRPPALNPNFAPQQNYAPPAQQPGYNTGPRLSPQQPRMPAPEPDGDYEDELYDEVPTPRAMRPSSTDYQQAYREAEYGYEDEAPRSRAPWILGGLVLATMLLAGLGVWLYQSSIKPLMAGQGTTQEVPAIAAPEVPAKVQAEQPAADTPQPAVAAPTKKQIYDRIVGDKEILGGDVAPPAEAPAAIPEPSTASDINVAPTTGGGGEDATPLPIPPPPGGAGDKQGSLDPASQKQSVDTITPAAGESQAAVAAQVPATLTPAQPPAPGELSEKTASTRSLVPEAEVIADPAPVLQRKPEAVVKRKSEVPKPKKVTEKQLGAKPVVLVAPQKRPQGKAKLALNNDDSNDAGPLASDGGIYGGDGILETVAPVAPAIAAEPKKRKTLFGDVFNSKSEPVETVTEQLTPEPSTVAAKKPVVVETQVASGAGGFVVQLASFRSKAEAQTEFTRLKAKHSGTLGRFSPIINEAQVGGATRYRLSVGSMPSKAQADAVCSSLFAGGERDCLVKSR
jgi:SPOR domain